MFTAITSWLTVTLWPILVNFILTYILTDVILALIMNISSSFFIDVVIDGGFLKFDEIDTWIGDLIGMQGFELSETIMVIAGVVLAINIVVEGVKIFISPITNNEISPSAFFSRCLVTIILFILYPTICDFVGEFLNAAINLPIFNISKLKEAFAAARSQTVGLGLFGTLIDGGVTGLLVCIVISTIMIKDIIFAGIIYVERYLSFALYLLLGPVCIAFYPNSTQKEMTRAWLKGIVSQIIVILLSIFALNLFCNQLINLSSSDALGGNKIAKLVVSIALLELVKNSEQLVNMLGLSTIPSGDTARMFLGGVAAAGVAISKASKLRKNTGDIIRKGNQELHGTQGSKTTMVSTGISKAGGAQTKAKMEENVGKGIVDSLQQKLGTVPSEKDIEKAVSGVTGNYGKMTPLKKFADDVMGGNKYKTEFGCSLPMDSKQNVLKSANEYANSLRKENATLATENPTSQAVLNAKKDPTGLKGVGKATELKFDGSKGFSKDNPNDDGNYWRGFKFAAKKDGQEDSEAKVGFSYSYGHEENGQWVSAKDPNAKESIAKLDSMNKTYESKDQRFDKGFKDQEQQIMKDVLNQGVVKDGVTSTYDFNNEKDKALFNENFNKVAKERGLYDVSLDSPITNTICSDDPEGGIRLLGNKTISGEENIANALGYKNNEYGADQLVESHRYNPEKGRCEVVTDMYKAKLDNNGEPITKYADNGNGEIKQSTELNKIIGSNDFSGNALLEKGNIMQNSMEKYKDAIGENIKEMSAENGRMFDIDNKRDYDELQERCKNQLLAKDHPFPYNDNDLRSFTTESMEKISNSPNEIADILNRCENKKAMNNIIEDVGYSKEPEFLDKVYEVSDISRRAKNRIDDVYGEVVATKKQESRIETVSDKAIDSLLGSLDNNITVSPQDINVKVDIPTSQNNPTIETPDSRFSSNLVTDNKQPKPSIHHVLNKDDLNDEKQSQLESEETSIQKREEEKKPFFSRKKKNRR